MHPSPWTRRAQRAGLLGLLGLGGCASYLPLPVNPFQIFAKQFPANVVTESTVQHPYTIKTDQFSYPAVNFSISRPNTTDWIFTPGNGNVTVSPRSNLGGTEPKPGVAVQLFGVVTPTDFLGAELKDVTSLLTAGASVTREVRMVAGVPADVVNFFAADPNTKLTVLHQRYYANRPDVSMSAEVFGDPGTVAKLGAYFTQILGSITLPALASAPGLPAVSLITQQVAGGVYTDGATKATIGKPSDAWVFDLGGARGDHIDLAVRRSATEPGLAASPQLVMKAYLDKDADLDKDRAAFAANVVKAQAKVAITQQAIGDATAELWLFDDADFLAMALTHLRVYVRNSVASVTLDATAPKASYANVATDFGKIVSSLTLPKGDPKPLTKVFQDPAASATATPDPAATSAATRP